MAKLSRKQIKEGLEAVPIDSLILGSAGAKVTRLTAKQKAFALEVARGETKAGAYRKAYKSKGNTATVANQGYQLAKRPEISAIIEAERAALEAEKYATPAALRALAVHQLKLHALDESFPPAQRVKCLELLGKITEVALFTERREIVKTEDSGQARDKLMAMLRQAITANAADADIVDADSLLAELAPASVQAETIDGQNAEGEGLSFPDGESPPAGIPQDCIDAAATPLHSIPHTQSSLNSPSTPYTKGDPSEVEGGINVENEDGKISV